MVIGLSYMMKLLMQLFTKHPQSAPLATVTNLRSKT